MSSDPVLDRINERAKQQRARNYFACWLVDRFPDAWKGKKKPRELLAKVTEIDQLPTEKEAIELIVYSQFVGDFFQETAKKIFNGKKRLLPYVYSAVCSGLNGAFLDYNVHHILTQEFVESLAEEIKHLNPQGTLVEIAAGTGKLSYWLNRYKVPIIPTDAEPTNDIVVRKTGQEALELYKPEFVLTSWLMPKDESRNMNTLQRRITETKSVKSYVEIGSVDLPCAAGVDRSGVGSQRFERRVLESVQKHSLPTDLLLPYLGDSAQIYTEVLPQLVDNTEEFLMKNPSVFLWTARD